MGRQNEAIAEAERAVQLDPFNQKVWSFQAQVLLSARRYDEAIAAGRAAWKLQPDAPVARTALLGAFFAKGMFEEAYANEMRFVTTNPQLKSYPDLKDALERGYAEAGYRGAERRLADVLATRFGKPGGVGAFHMANLYVHGGDGSRALGWLERACEARDPNMPYLRGPQWDSVRADPRFQDLMRRVGLPQ
jgi:tetratricopeptide (TPR) repeat protein